MTKSEKIFKDTYYACLRHLEQHGKEYNSNSKPVGFTNLISDSALYKYTFDCVQKHINTRRKEINIAQKYGVYTQEKYDNYVYALDMTQVTLDNNIKHFKDLGIYY